MYSWSPGDATAASAPSPAPPAARERSRGKPRPSPQPRQPRSPRQQSLPQLSNSVLLLCSTHAASAAAGIHLLLGWPPTCGAARSCSAAVTLRQAGVSFDERAHHPCRCSTSPALSEPATKPWEAVSPRRWRPRPARRDCRRATCCRAASSASSRRSGGAAGRTCECRAGGEGRGSALERPQFQPAARPRASAAAAGCLWRAPGPPAALGHPAAAPSAHPHNPGRRPARLWGGPPSPEPRRTPRRAAARPPGPAP